MGACAKVMFSIWLFKKYILLIIGMGFGDSMCLCSGIPCDSIWAVWRNKISNGKMLHI